MTFKIGGFKSEWTKDLRSSKYSGDGLFAYKNFDRFNSLLQTYARGTDIFMEDLYSLGLTILHLAMLRYPLNDEDPIGSIRKNIDRLEYSQEIKELLMQMVVVSARTYDYQYDRMKFNVNKLAVQVDSLLKRRENLDRNVAGRQTGTLVTLIEEKRGASETGTSHSSLDSTKFSDAYDRSQSESEPNSRFPNPKRHPSDTRNPEQQLIFSGLPNSYLNCYMNATLQCLFADTDFMNILRKFNQGLASKVLALDTHSPNSDVKTYQYGLDPRISDLEAIGSRVMLTFGAQQCSHMLFMNLVNELSREIETYTSRESSLRKLFEVDVEYVSKCTQCKYQIDASEQNYISLSLPIPAPNYSSSYSQVKISLCFEVFLKPKPVKLPCTKCCRDSATHTAFLISLPKILVIHFQRYLDGRKDQRVITFPEVLEIPVQNNMLRYEVFGVVYHSGSLIGGHYYAHVKYGGFWFEANDSIVEKTSLTRPQEEGAYLLFCRQLSYERNP